MYEYDSKNYKGYTIKAVYDECPMNPRECDNLGTIYSGCRYAGDENLKDAPFFDKWENEVKVGELNRDYIWLPMSIFEHGGVRIYVGEPCDRWDSGRFGLIAVSKDAVRKEWGWKKLTKERVEKIEGILKGEVEEYSSYCNGDVYGYIIEDEDENQIDSCWGYIGDDGLDALWKDAKASVDCEIRRTEMEAEKEAKMELILSTCGID